MLAGKLSADVLVSRTFLVVEDTDRAVGFSREVFTFGIDDEVLDGIAA